jgi:hypothetical protein
MTAKTRTHKRYPRDVDFTPRMRHGREDESAPRESVRRPVNATPRRAADWR